MKKKLFTIGALLALVFTSCTKERGVDLADNSLVGAVQFSASGVEAMTKVTGTIWDAGDAIGVTATSTDAAASKVNAKYTTTGGSPAEFTAADESQTLYFSESGAAITFDAYYPYQEDWSASSQVFDITVQNDGQLNDADFMLSATLADQTSGVQNLTFTHSFSKVQITIANYEGNSDSQISSFEDLSVTVADVATQYDLLEDSYSTLGEVAMQIELDDDLLGARATAILLPTSTDAKVVFTVGEVSYTATLKVDPLQSGMQHSYSVVLGEPQIEIALTSEGIDSWIDNGSSTPSEFFAEKDGVYTIDNDFDLELFFNRLAEGDDFSGKTIELTADVSSADLLWLIYTDNQQPFQGTLDGGGHTISDFTVVYEYSALLPVIGSEGVVKNLIIGSGGSTRSNTAAIACENNGVISSCHNVGFVVNSNGYSSASIASVNNGTIINCSNSVDITGQDSGVGGIAASNAGMIINCYNVGSVTGSMRVGGIAASNSGVIESCYSASTLDGSSFLGSIAGYNEGTITSCYFDATLCDTGVGQGDDATTGYSTDDMQGDDLIVLLNNGAYTYNQTSPKIEAYGWKASDEGYPEFDTENEPTYTQFDIEYDSASDVYLIYSADGLTTFAAEVNSGSTSINGKLMKDIELSGTWSSMVAGGSESYGYGGTFDGNGYSITGLSVSGSESGQGLFGTTLSATIKNLKVGGEVSNSASHAAIIAGKAWYTTFTDCQALEGSTVSGTSGDSFAGIAGYSYQCSFTSCINRADITGVSCSAGITGYTNDNTSYSTITDCKNYGAITATSTSNGHAAGIVGTTNAKAILVISNCYNEGVIKSESGNFAGGIIAKMYGTSSSRYSKVMNCANIGAVSAAGQYVGGLVGACAGSAIYNSYNLGEVSGDSSEVGGLVGIHEAYSSYGSVMENCYTCAAVSGESNVGLVVGKCDSATITSCYYDDSQSGDAIGSDSSDQSVAAYSSFAELLTALNSGTSNIAGAATWVAGTDSYPTF
ncbi:MAG: fimbrillin family protein [Rikenellaceae bacterium]